MLVKENNLKENLSLFISEFENNYLYNDNNKTYYQKDNYKIENCHSEILYQIHKEFDILPNSFIYRCYGNLIDFIKDNIIYIEEFEYLDKILDEFVNNIFYTNFEISEIYCENNHLLDYCLECYDQEFGINKKEISINDLIKNSIYYLNNLIKNYIIENLE